MPDAAAHAFVRQGYAGASMRAIAASLGISGPASIRHIHSKEEAFEAVCIIGTKDSLSRQYKATPDRRRR